MKKRILRSAPFLLFGLMLLSAYLIVEQVFFKQHGMLHHTVVCTTIFVFAAVMLKYRKKSLMAKCAVVFALLGMVIGVYEMISLLIS